MWVDGGCSSLGSLGISLHGVSFHSFFGQQIQSNHISYMVPQGFQGVFLRKRATTFYDLFSEILHDHFRNILFIKTITGACSGSRRGKINSTLNEGEAGF